MKEGGPLSMWNGIKQWLEDIGETGRAALATVSGAAGIGFIQMSANAKFVADSTRPVFAGLGAVLLLAVLPILNDRCVEPVKALWGWCVGCFSMPLGFVGALVALFHYRTEHPNWPNEQNGWLALAFLLLALLAISARRRIPAKRLVEDNNWGFPEAELFYILVNGIPVPLATFLTILALSIFFPDLFWGAAS